MLSTPERSNRLRSHILFVSHTAESVGPTNSLLLLAKGLRDEFKASVLLPGRGAFLDDLKREDIPVLSLPSLNKWSLPRIGRLIRRERVNLVYANNTRSCSRVAFVAATLSRKPFICHVRSMEWQAGWARLGYLRLAKAVVAVSEACAESVRRFVVADRLYVVHNGVSLSDFPVAPKTPSNRLRRELGLAADSLLLVSVSHVCPRKGQQYAVEAMAEVLRRVPSAHLCIIGRLDRDPSYVAQLRTLAQNLGIDGHLHLLGFRSDVPDILSQADIFLHTAVTDPHPRAVIEAMAGKLPVVAFAADGVAETVVDGVTGRLSQVKDIGSLTAAVLELASSQATRRRMGSAGRNRAETHYSSDATTEKVKGIVSRVLSDSQRRVG